ncbi:alpha/beta hydrolase [Arcanobacterium phocae]|uniref:alpha/beta hydrolase n=1 Tax=Arcanobacterium phocae TaxID=131112 RepID=UPI001C0EE8C5|nr:alpha/beta hydrolase [Arcanobacterium phocae]
MKKRLTVALSAAVLLLSSCSGGLWGLTDDESGKSKKAELAAIDAHAIEAEMPEIPAGLESFYTQDVTWKKCGIGLDCATITVPLNYADPTGKTIELALKRRHADGGKIGSLLANPGGPGGGGQEMAESAFQFFSKRILDKFDVVGFDPRGVGDSTPVDCVSDAELDDNLATVYPETPAGKAQSHADEKDFGEKCVQNSGDLVAYVGTEEAARDMDVIRHIVGDPKLYYVGFSYGTKLGGMYAELFPTHVGRLILDGAVDSDVSEFEQLKAQLKGFELATNNYIDDCLKQKSCPFDGTRDEARAEIRAMFDHARETPLPTADENRPLTQSGLLYGFITPLYDDASWPILTQAIEEYKNEGTGNTFQVMFDAYVGRTPSGTYSNNSMEAHAVINCADTVVTDTPEDWDRLSEELAKESPLFGDMMGYSQGTCMAMPKPDHPITQRFTASGSDPIVVVGTVGDPATPYEWAVAFEKAFENAVLVTWEGEGHTAYGRASGTCVKDALDAYLLNGTVPEDGLRCPAQ